MQNKSLVVITGASSGIGAAVAKFFSEEGYMLGLIARNIEPMKKLNLPNSMCLSVDVTDYVALKNAISHMEEKFGSIDCLINNAGYVKVGDFIEIDHIEHEKMVNINFQGVINGIEAVLTGMRDRNKGTIINISSVADRNARPNNPTYAATKAAVKSLTESLRMANAKYGIRICNLAPAKILTPMLVSSSLNDNQAISANELAKIVLWMYEQPQHICIRDLVVAPTYYDP